MIMVRGLRRLRIALYLLLLLAGLLPGYASAQERPVYILKVDGPVTPVMLSYISRGIEQAEADAASALVIQLDTPGGSVDLTKQITQRMLEAGVPVVVYIAPRGAHAASAGTFITLAAHVAAMAPGTSIGAASPVSTEGQDLSETMKSKAVNILTADIEGLAKRRGEKAVEWAKEAVSEARAATADQALELGVIDFVADDLNSLLKQIEGFNVEVRGEKVTIHVAGRPRRELPMTSIEEFLHTITNPNIAFILMTLGINGILFELSSPGGYVAGIVGGICLLLGLYALGVLSANYIGFLFIVLALVLFILDIKAPTHGILTAGGILSFAIGSLVLFNTPYAQVSTTLVISVTLAMGAFFAFVIGKVVGAQRRQPKTGQEGLIGALATARTPLTPEGMVFVQGERWDAVAEDGPIDQGQRVRVTAVDGVRLHVRKATDS